MAALKAEVGQLKEAIGGMVTQAALPARVNRAEADIARVALDVAAIGQMRADIAALKEVVLQRRFGLLDSLIVPNFPRLFKEFRAKLPHAPLGLTQACKILDSSGSRGVDCPLEKSDRYCGSHGYAGSGLFRTSQSSALSQFHCVAHPLLTGIPSLYPELLSD
jgi:hypothetical protein